MKNGEIAEKIINDFLYATKKDKILIVKDSKSKIVKCFEEAVKKKGFENKTVTITSNRVNSSPVPGLEKDLAWADVVIAPTSKSITHSPQTTKAVKEGKRILTLPGITEKIFKKIGKVNFEEIQKENIKILKQVNRKDKVIVKTKHGTDISFSIKGRRWVGLRAKKGKGFVGNLPNGEMFCAPVENSANGKIVIDYFGTKIKPKNNAWLILKNGKIIEWSKGAEPLIKELTVENGKIIAEFGIGTNKAHRKPIGNILHDEKIFQSCHIAFGNNVSFGGKNKSKVHNDVILMKPTVLVDGKKLKW